MLVREIRRFTSCTAVPGAPAHYRGLVNIRGQVATIVDLRERLGWSEHTRLKQEEKKGYFIILKTKPEVKEWYKDDVEKRCPWEDRVGIVVDRLGVVQDFTNDGFQPRPANLEGISAHFAEGVVELDKNLLIVLNMPALLGYVEVEEE
uniref:Putative chemoyaxis protein CheW-like protein n=1 Tax=Magnetococcus massalia (strain MO-1) TaxID=451514 RepID=A0A1S7LDC9_MAGMO|nr:putative chemoyaxis protein CheW-like protein [Candidatus Magnetococcus massalia]